jgi:HEAT repeat protein
MSRSANTRKYIEKILYGDTIPGKADLVHLSDLNTDDLEVLKREWAAVESTRRQMIISQLVHHAASNFTYDFREIFRFCLYDPDPGIRSAAITGLTEEEDDLFISRLTRFVQDDPAEEVREAAVTALGKFAIFAELGDLPDHDSKTIYNVLLSVLNNQKEGAVIRSEALVSIAAFHVTGVKTLIEEAYNGTDMRYKRAALRAMGRNCDPLWLDTLFKEFENDDTEIKFEAIMACGELSDEKAVPALIGFTGDKNPRIREAAIMALGEIGGQKAREVLNNLAKNSRGRTRQAAELAIKELDICEDFLSMNS